MLFEFYFYFYWVYIVILNEVKNLQEILRCTQDDRLY